MLPKQFISVTCNKCGTVYVAVPRAWAENEVKESNEYQASLSKKDKEIYGSKNPASIALYEWCWCKNIYKNFRDAKEGDCPDGCTLSTIIDRKD